MMRASPHPCYSSTLSSHIHCFLDGRKILKLIDLVSLEEDSIAYVIGCYFGVAEGVGILFDDKSENDQRLFCYLVCNHCLCNIMSSITCDFNFLFRYRLKIKAGDDFDEFEFVMYDDVVEKFAPVACSKFPKEVMLCGMNLWF
jgi:hypothetical protein